MVHIHKSIVNSSHSTHGILSQQLDRRAAWDHLGLASIRRRNAHVCVRFKRSISVENRERQGI